MPHAFAQVYLHLVFSTKERRPFIQDPGLRDKLHKYLAGISNGQECPCLEVGGAADHVHVLCRLGRTIEIATLIRELKRDSSRWVKQESQEIPEFSWQSGYGVFSVSPSHVPILRQYIRNQEQHHRKESYQDEFRRLCRKYGIEIDEEHAWE